MSKHHRNPKHVGKKREGEKRCWRNKEGRKNLNRHTTGTGTNATIGLEGTHSRNSCQLGSGTTMQPLRVWQGIRIAKDARILPLKLATSQLELEAMGKT